MCEHLIVAWLPLFSDSNTLTQTQQRSSLTRCACVIRATPPQSQASFNEDTHTGRLDQSSTAGSSNQGKVKCHFSRRWGSRFVVMAIAESGSRIFSFYLSLSLFSFFLCSILMYIIRSALTVKAKTRNTLYQITTAAVILMINTISALIKKYTDKTPAPTVVPCRSLCLVTHLHRVLPATTELTHA